MPTYRMAVTSDLGASTNFGVNVWHWRSQGDPTSSAAFDGAVDAIHQFYEDVGIFANGTTIRADVAQEVGTDQQFPVDFTDFTVGDSGIKAPPELALVVNWYSASASRRGRGRTFLGPIHGACIESDGTVENNYLQGARAAANALVASSLADPTGWGIGVYGLVESGGTPESPHVLRDFTRARINDRFGWLRSRSR